MSAKPNIFRINTIYHYSGLIHIEHLAVEDAAPGVLMLIFCHYYHAAMNHLLILKQM